MESKYEGSWDQGTAKQKLGSLNLSGRRNILPMALGKELGRTQNVNSTLVRARDSDQIGSKNEGITSDQLNFSPFLLTT